MKFEILGDIRNVETIATGRGVYIRRHLDRTYGKGRWPKMKEWLPSSSATGRYGMPKSTGLKRTGLDVEISR